jgi:hypothetical protein
VAAVVPHANPDFEVVYQRVTHWWLEVNDAGEVTREVGFDVADRPIAAAPLGDNHGIFTDLDGAPRGLGQLIPPELFEEVWQDVSGRFKSGAPGGGLAGGAA